MSTEEQAQLVPFLLAAKLACYAADDERQVLNLHDGGSEVSFARGELLYRDRWYGGATFSGQELVWRAGRALWSMSYHGATLPGPAAELFHFHKRALSRAPQAAPWRGPAVHREGELLYVNDWSGSVSRFRGVERALRGDAELLRVEYQGGLLD